jgi:hypothetical protein
MLFQSLSLATAVSLAPQLMIWEDMPQYIYEQKIDIVSRKQIGTKYVPMEVDSWRPTQGKQTFLCKWIFDKHFQGYR